MVCNETRQGPTLRCHKRSGNAYAKFNGVQKWFGAFGDRATHAGFHAFKAAWEANGRRIPHEQPAAEVTIADLVAAYLDRHVHEHYRKPDGTPTSEPANIVRTFKHVLPLFGELPVAKFGPLKLQAVRERFIELGWCRGQVNQAVGRVKRAFKWGASQELVPPAVWHGLQSLAGLRYGRGGAREGRAVPPVTWEQVAATLPLLSPQVRAMVLFMWWTGARVGEVVQMRIRDIERGGRVWIYRPATHKTQHHGREREIAIGPHAQEELLPFLKLDPDAVVFNPKEEERQRHERRRAERETPLWPSHVAAQERKRVNKDAGRGVPGETWDAASVRAAIRRAAKAANVEHWHPHQLRHAAATRIRKESGLEAARVILGHSSAAVSELYAEVDRAKALEIMERCG